jgi:hypothetical protein
MELLITDYVSRVRGAGEVLRQHDDKSVAATTPRLSVGVQLYDSGLR